MRWLWRLLLVIVTVALVKNIFFTQPQVFIAWPETYLTKKVEWELRNLRTKAQDLPAAMETSIRQLLQDYQVSGRGKSI